MNLMVKTFPSYISPCATTENSGPLTPNTSSTTDLESMTTPFVEPHGQNMTAGKPKMANSHRSVAVSTNKSGVSLIATTSISEKE
jgi:hypothetical protein